MLNRWYTGVGIGAIALVLTGCGNAESGSEGGAESGTEAETAPEVDPQEDPAGYFQAVADATKDSGSYRMKFSVAQGGTDAGETEALVVYEGDGIITEIAGGMGMGEDTKLVQTSEAIYLSGMPDLPAEFADKWIKIDLGSEFAQMFGGGSTEMLDVEMFSEFAGDIELSAADGEEIDGVATQEISFTLTKDQLATNLPEDSPVADLAESQLQDTDYVLSVGEDMLVREMSVKSGDLISMDASLFDYGVDGDIEVPADGDTVSFEEIMQSAGGGA